MKRLSEGNLAHDFPEAWTVTKYDDWAFYRKQFQNCCGGNKAIDFLGYDPNERTLWMVELKDYRQFSRTKDADVSLWEEVALKARDTLAGIFAASAKLEFEECGFANAAMKAGKLRVVLHLEQPAQHSALFPRAYDPASIQQKLKQIVKPIDPHPRVVELNRMNAVPWSAVSIA